MFEKLFVKAGMFDRVSVTNYVMNFNGIAFGSKPA